MIIFITDIINDHVDVFSSDVDDIETHMPGFLQVCHIYLNQQFSLFSCFKYKKAKFIYYIEYYGFMKNALPEKL